MSKLKEFSKALKGFRFLFVLTLLSAVVSVTSKLAIPFLAGKAVNLIFYGTGSMDFSVYLILFGVFLAGGLVFGYLFQFLTSYIGQRVIRNIRDDLFKKYLRCEIKTLDQKRKGDLILRLINDIENIQTGLVNAFAVFFEGVVTIIITIVFMFVINWVLALMVVCLTPISLVVSRFIGKFNSKHFKRQASTLGSLTAFAHEGLDNSETVTTYNLEGQREEDFEKLNQTNREAAFKALLGASFINPTTRIVNNTINVCLILVGSLLILFNVNVGVLFLVGDLSAFLTYASNYMSPFNEISSVASEIDYALASLRRVNEALAYPDDKDEGTITEVKEINSLQASHIDFSYDGKRQIIKDFDLDIYKGHKIALVGPTGSGKTTIINLLLRFYDADKGSFIFDGVNTLDIKKSAVRQKVGMVLQDTWIFKGTVFENIAYGKKNATQEEVEEAAKKAQAHNFIERLPQGYQTVISDNGALSTGEKQLIQVARALLTEHDIVILDEATSNIDIHTEQLLNVSFQKLMAHKTSLIVAHRLSTIIEADLIVVLKDGQIIEMGNHKELMAKKGFYYSLFNAQFA